MSAFRSPMTDEMPYSPKRLCVPRYALPNLFGKFEREEAVARLFTLIQQKGVWDGVTWRELVEQMKAEFEARKAENEAARAYPVQVLAYDKAYRRYLVLSVLTLGLYAIFVKKPLMPQRPQPVGIMSIVWIKGPGAIAKALHDLVADGLVRTETIGEGDDADDVFYPTVQLAKTLEPYARLND